jgi:hypothetical protein
MDLEKQTSLQNTDLPDEQIALSLENTNKNLFIRVNQ